jgi:hypothetical protein
MALGPIELFVLSFPQTGTGEVGPAIRSLVDSGTIRIVDILFVAKDADGNLTRKEIVELDDQTLATFDPMVDDVAGLLSESDVEWLSRLLEPNTSAAMMLLEHTWAIRVRDAIVNAGGQVLMAERIPRQTIDELTAEHTAA